MTAETTYYATPAPMTALPPQPGLPTDAREICSLAQGLIVHEFLADQYGVPDAAARQEEVENRSAREIVAAIRSLDDRPLTEAREPRLRMVGNCRHFTVLTVALLRQAGIPARARAGFADYFTDEWTDHWVVERWDRSRWVRTDAQIDARMKEVMRVEFDPFNVPEGRFLSGGEAWARCRAGAEDPQRFGIQDMHGMWFIAGNVIRDLAALNKVELLPWDMWGLMSLTLDEHPLLDEVAAADDLTDLRALFEQDGLRVPDKVHSYRFGRDVRVEH